MYYKKVIDGEIETIGETSAKTLPDGFEDITSEEYDSIMEQIRIASMDKEEVSDDNPIDKYGISKELFEVIIDDYTLELYEEGII